MVDQGFLRAEIWAVAGLPPVPAAEGLAKRLAQLAPHPLFLPEIAASRHIALPTGGQRPDMPGFGDPAFDGWNAATGARYGSGLYGEKRAVYTSAQFADAVNEGRRMAQLGVDVFARAGTPVFAPLDGEAVQVWHNADDHTLILAHEGFYTLYGHLGATLPGRLRPAQKLRSGQLFAHLGDWPENGGWSAHAAWLARWIH